MPIDPDDPGSKARSSSGSRCGSCAGAATSSSARPGTASCAPTPASTCPTSRTAGPRCCPRTPTARPAASATGSAPGSASTWPSSSATRSAARGGGASPTSPSAAPASAPSSTCGAPTDALGRELQVTEVCVVDELAAAAELVMGKATGIVRGRRAGRRPVVAGPGRGAAARSSAPPPRTCSASQPFCRTSAAMRRLTSDRTCGHPSGRPACHSSTRATPSSTGGPRAPARAGWPPGWRRAPTAAPRPAEPRPDGLGDRRRGGRHRRVELVDRRLDAGADVDDAARRPGRRPARRRRRTSSTYTKSRVCSPSPKIVHASPASSRAGERGDHATAWRRASPSRVAAGARRRWRAPAR